MAFWKALCHQNKPAVSWGFQMLQQKTEQTTERLNTTTVSLAGMEVRQAAAALPCTDPHSSGGNISIIIWPAAAPSRLPSLPTGCKCRGVTQAGSHQQPLSSDMPLTPNTTASRRPQMDGLEKDSQVDSGILGGCLSIPGKA